MSTAHSFYIPVMGVGFTLDTPIKVAKYGISSVISLVQDDVIEQAREFYAKTFKKEYKPIALTEVNYRASRITAYLNLVNEIVKQEFDGLKQNLTDLKTYFDYLPSTSELKQRYLSLSSEKTFDSLADFESLLPLLKTGNIDVNIMSKLNRIDEKEIHLPEALAALKGFAESDLDAALVISAGVNPKLVSFLEEFKDFFPTQRKNEAKKQVILKVSDFRSAIIQGKMLAKKGIWVSEFRIESGLNCGGHAFATNGLLLGKVLEEFKTKRLELETELQKLYFDNLAERGIEVSAAPLMKITVQGGVGTAQEHEFLKAHYGVDDVGWGSPFLLVPEATSVDEQTLIKLAEADEKDIYLSNASPLGVRYNNLRNSGADLLRKERIEKGKPGSPCFKKHVAINNEFTEEFICTASREYQKKKIQALQAENLSEEEYKLAYEKVVEKECICDGLAVSFLKKYNLTTKRNNPEASVCPGPNLAYFNRIYSLKEMIDHIYDRQNLICLTRPNMFLKELSLYVDYFKEEWQKFKDDTNVKKQKELREFKSNLKDGIAYYHALAKELANNLFLSETEINHSLQQFSLDIDAL